MKKPLFEHQLDEKSLKLAELLGLDIFVESEIDSMKKKSFENGCKAIMDLLSESDVNNIISEMIEKYNREGVYYDQDNAENILKTSLSNFSAVLSSVEWMTLEETKDWEKEYDADLSEYILLETKEQYRDSSIQYARKRIFRYILDAIQEKAHKAIEKKVKEVYIRKEKGMLVDFIDCEYAIPYNDHIEFFKDGGWGIATSEGMVKIPNNIITQPSECGYYNYISFNPFLRIVQSRDNAKYGVISLSSFEIIIPLEYERIEEFGNNNYRPKCSLLKALNDGLWGCFNENGVKVSECKYDEIKLEGDLIECFRDGEYLKNDELDPHTGDIFYDGKRDLYNKNGEFLIGGYSLRERYFSDIYYYYFGTSYECYSVKEHDLWDRCEFELWKYRINYDNSVCLILDGNLKTVVKSNGKCFQFPKGKCIESIQELISIVPKQLLFHNEVNFWSEHFIFQKQRLGEKTIVQETKTVKTYQPHIRPATQEERELSLLFLDTKIEEVKEDYVYSKVTEDVLEEDDRVIITCLSKENDILWSSSVNELGKLNGCWLYAYRIGKSVGFYSDEGLKEAAFAGITYKDGKYIVARIESQNTLDEISNNNPNFLWKITYTDENEEIEREEYLFLKYYEYADGELISVCNDWKIFNPAKQNWFPDTFKTTYRIYDNDDNCYDDGSSRGNEWTDEDAWDAMTDGMYGDYTGSGWDSEWLGF